MTAEPHRQPSAGKPSALETLLSAGWPFALFVGLVTVALGVIVLAWPGERFKVLAVLFGLHLLLFGLFRLISAFDSSSVSPGVVGFVGVLGTVAGVLVLRHPFETGPSSRPSSASSGSSRGRST